MNDGTINTTPTSVPQQPNATSQNVTVKVEDLPPEIPVNKIISGEVIANDKSHVTIKTDQGNVILDVALDLILGQKVNLKIQQVMQQSVSVPVAELINIPIDKVIRPNEPVVQPPVLNPVMQDPVIVHDPSPFQEYKPLQAMVMQMPDILNDETVVALLKTVMNLPMNKPLPLGIQQGLEKFTQLTQLLSQANLLPGNEVKTPVQTNGIQQNILTALQQVVQNITGKQAQNNPLLIQTPQKFIQLQAIQPGQNLSPNILVDMKQQLITLLQPGLQPSSVIPVPEKPSGMMSLLPTPLTGIIQKAGNALNTVLNLSTEQGIMPTGNKSLFTAPMVGLILGTPAQQPTQIPNANFVLMLIPSNQPTQQGQQLVGLIAPQQTDGQQQTLLPGSVIVAAVQPQEQKNLSFTVLPQQALVEAIKTFLPLNMSLGDNWPILDEIWDQALAQQTTAPEVLAALRQTIPAPSAQQMPPTMLFFLSVLKNGFTKEWAGEKHLAALAGIDKDNLIKSLAQDLQTIKNRMDESLPSDTWRPLPIPLQVGDQLMRLQWFYRHPEEEYRQSTSEQEDSTEKKRKTRFLLNVPKTAVGDIQIDGLVQERKLDLILRTENTLLSHMETAIRGRYAAVLETTGMVGGIDFQSGKHHYVHV